MNTQQINPSQKTKAREVITFSSSLNLMTLNGGHHVFTQFYNF